MRGGAGQDGPVSCLQAVLIVPTYLVSAGCFGPGSTGYTKSNLNTPACLFASSVGSDGQCSGLVDLSLLSIRFLLEQHVLP